jgi:hypothetical protein
MADDAIDAAGDQGVPGLDGDETAEPIAEHDDRADPQRAAGHEQGDAEPADGVAVDGPEIERSV